MTDHAMTLRISEEMHARLRREAYEQCTSISDIVRGALRDQIRDWDRDDSSPWPVSRAAARAVSEPHDSGGER
jgi:predicted transcriptional regulator